MFFFCETCGTAICRDCTVLDHQKTEGHIIIGIKKATDSHHQTLEDQLLKSQAMQAEIQSAIQEVESKIQTIHDDKESAKGTLVTFIQYVQHQLEQCQKEATDTISQYHTDQHEKLMGNKSQLQQAEGLLDKHISQSKQLTKSHDINDIISCKGKLEKATEITKSNFDQRANYPKYDLISVPNLLNDSVPSIGKTCLQSLLPANYVIRNDKITAGLQSVIAIELFNDGGNSVAFAPPFLTVQITDPQQDELPVTFSTTYPDCTVIFTPQVSGRHEISVLHLGLTLKSEQTHIMVKSNNPVMKFGRYGNDHGTFDHPCSIAMDNNGVLYVGDNGNRLIQKFSDKGVFISQFRVNNHDRECAHRSVTPKFVTPTAPSCIDNS